MKKIVVVQSGDIASVTSDALITAINSAGMWAGGIDGVIMRSAGDLFHQQAANAMPLCNKRVVVAKGHELQNRGKFKNVIFVVDDLKSPLREIVTAGLNAAEEACFSEVTLPTIRMGVMLGQVEKNMDEVMTEVLAGVNDFLYSDPQKVTKITFVVYHDSTVELLLRTTFGQAGLLAQ